MKENDIWSACNSSIHPVSSGTFTHTTKKCPPLPKTQRRGRCTVNKMWNQSQAKAAQGPGPQHRDSKRSSGQAMLCWGSAAPNMLQRSMQIPHSTADQMKQNLQGWIQKAQLLTSPCCCLCKPRSWSHCSIQRVGEVRRCRSWLRESWV